MKRAELEALMARFGKRPKDYQIRPEQYPSTPGLKRYERDRVKWPTIQANAGPDTPKAQ